MQEKFLHHIWANGLYKHTELLTHTGKRVKILDPGKYNRDAGPDFFNAKVSIDDIVWIGNVEIHWHSSDWYRHGHHLDAAYDNVILSVVCKDDVKVFDRMWREKECLVLEYADYLYEEYLFMKNTGMRPACLRNLDAVDDALFYLSLQSLAVERLERKVGDMLDVLKVTAGDWAECLYRMICKYWAGHVNADPFYQLSIYLPYKIILKYTGNLLQVEALIFGVSGILSQAEDDAYTLELKREYHFLKQKHHLAEMSPVPWKYMRMRPDNFPTIRMALLASFFNQSGNLIARFPSIESPKEFKTLLHSEVSAYWKTHYRFGAPSVERKKSLGQHFYQNMFINVVIPFIFLYGRERDDRKLTDRALAWMEEEKAEDNFITRMWQKNGFVFESAAQSQGVIQLYREYCEKHRCLHCRLGREILKSLLHNDLNASQHP